jgi:hypothetical protein
MVQHKAGALAYFFDLLVVRYQGDIYRLTGVLMEQLIGEMRPHLWIYGTSFVPDIW